MPATSIDAIEVSETLTSRKQEILARLARIQRDRRRPGDPDSKEQAVERQNDEVIDRLDRAERLELAEIERGLERIESGSYGICDDCGCDIDPGRLRVSPAAGLCVKCAGALDARARP